VNALCLSGLLLLAWSPTGLWDPGFQLSFAATAGLVYLAAPLAALFHTWGWPRWLAVAVGASLGAQLPVTPIMAAHFNQLSLIGVVANLVVVPLAGPATTLGMLAVAVHAISERAASLLFNALWFLLLALRVAVWAAAAVPGAMVHVPAPAWPAIATWCGALLLAPHLASRRWTRAVALALVTATAALCTWPFIPRHAERLRIAFLDVGQGDATLIELPEGQRILVDGGPGGAGRFDVGERVLSPLLWNLPVHRLDVVAVTHADADHIGGLAAVLRHFAIGEVWETGRWRASGDETLRALAHSRAARHVLTAGQRLWIGSARFTVLNPDREPSLAANDDSLVLRLDWRDLSVLLTGDLGWPGEMRILERAGAVELPSASARMSVRATVLKVGHHGSRFASSGPFLDAVQPTLAVISAGVRNPFHHPSAEVMTRLAAVGARVYRTDRDGAVIVESDGATMWVSRWASRSTERFELRRGDEPPST
jgi:competence protein ComEC